MVTKSGHLDHNQHQGGYGEVFVRVLAIAAGFTVARADLDVDGTDMTLSAPGPRGTSKRPKIDVQVKSWRSPVSSRDGTALEYPLTVDNYNKLTTNSLHERPYLFVVVVPDDPGLFLLDASDHSKIHHCAYWVSLEGRSPSSKGSSSKETVTIPKAHRLTVRTLTDLIEGRDHEATVQT